MVGLVMSKQSANSPADISRLRNLRRISLRVGSAIALKVSLDVLPVLRIPSN